MSTGSRLPYQYVVLRCVPRVDREEFLNVGVVLFCDATDAAVDIDQLCEALVFVEGVCAGDERGGAAAKAPIRQRFGFLKAPRSTMLQPGPVHGGVTTDPARQLEHLLERFVG